MKRKKFNWATLLFLVLEILAALNIVMACCTKQVSLLTYVMNCICTMLAFLYAELSRQENRNKRL